eukprot:TRINITY_DN50048_c0_g1_i1.p1 TRINITY_DN50048_c0_g1~~TRINITY_DN50048_c0_g1_i1.p1  ORF type:complete len:218 (-),score=40.55 TRINITY_DN50048_c0_g1_i1:56-709(-)
MGNTCCAEKAENLALNEVTSTHVLDKYPGVETPAATGYRFEVVVEKLDENGCETADLRIGLRLVVDEREIMCIVAAIRQGSIMDAWNKTHPKQSVEIGDRLLEVNGRPYNLETFEKTKGSVELLFLRPEATTLSFAKESKSFGVSFFASNQFLFIKSISEGSMFQERARRAGVGEGDRIFNVNGKTGLPCEMLMDIEKLDSLELEILMYRLNNHSHQ